MKIISIDPGYERLGIAILERIPGEKEKLLYSDCFKTDKKIPHHQRLGMISEEISRIIKDYSPEILSIEGLFFSNNQKTAITVAEARGVILAEAAKNNISVYEYNPGQIKLAITGYGKSDKKAVIQMVKRLIKINKEIIHDDEYDAIAIGLTCFAIEKLFHR